MIGNTWFLRFMLVLMLIGLVPVAGLIYLMSVESAASWPELAHLRLPLYVAVLIGFVPVVLAITAALRFLKTVDQGQATTARTVQLLHRLRVLAGVFAGYLALFLAGAWTAMQLMHPSLLFVWLGTEVGALFVYALVSLLERRFSIVPEPQGNSNYSPAISLKIS